MAALFAGLLLAVVVTAAPAGFADCHAAGTAAYVVGLFLVVAPIAMIAGMTDPILAGGVMPQQPGHGHEMR